MIWNLSFGIYAIHQYRHTRHGRTIGIPTANFEVADGIRHALKHFGVYAAYVTVRGERHPAALFWGHRTLFHDEEPVCEALLIDFSGDIYGEDVVVEIISFIRDTITVEHEDELKRLMKEDVERVKLLISN